MRLCSISHSFALLLLLFLPWLAVAQEAPLRIYIDADRTAMPPTGQSIEWGIRTALSEVDNTLGGHPEVLIRGHRDFINEQSPLVLDPWATAAPITRPAGEDSWNFRLSVDDKKGGPFIAPYISSQGYSKPYLLLEETGWGHSNEAAMKAALKELGISPVNTDRFQWHINRSGARILGHQIVKTDADVIFLVANAPEGERIYGPWLSLPPAQGVLARAQQLGLIETPLDLKTPTGFIHAYDLTHLLIAATQQTGVEGDMIETLGAADLHMARYNQRGEIERVN